MRIVKGTLFSFSFRTNPTIEIPEPKPTPLTPPEYENVPDEWLVRLDYLTPYPITRGKKGILHLSRIGWEANHAEIKTSFDLGRARKLVEYEQDFAAGCYPAHSADWQPITWAQFETQTMGRYTAAAEQHAKQLARLRQELADYEQVPV